MKMKKQIACLLSAALFSSSTVGSVFAYDNIESGFNNAAIVFSNEGTLAYSSLSEAQKSAYDLLKTNCDAFLVSKKTMSSLFFTSVALETTITLVEATEVYNALVSDCPQYYFLNGFKGGGTEEAITKIYLMLKKDYQKYEARAKFIIPQNVKAEAGNEKVTITWDEVMCAEKYDVQRKKGEDWESIGNPAETSFADISVVGGTEYSYRVLAFINNTWCDASEVVTATPKAAAVTVPQNVTAEAGEGKVTVTWDAVDGATKYRVQRSTGTTWSTVSYPTTASYVDTNVTGGTEYSYRVLAYVNDTWSAASAVVKATPKVSAVPQNVKAAAGEGKVTITWSAVTGATKYRIQRSTGTAWSTVSYPTSASYVDTNVTGGTEYSYRVLAYVNDTWSAASAVVKATPKASAVPQNVKAAAGEGKVTITWSAVTGATKYRIQRSTGTAWSTVSYPTATSYVDTNVTAGTTYSYRVLAYVNDTWSAASAVVKAAPKASVIPQNVKAAVNNKRVTLTWSAVTGATKYRIQRLNGTAWSTVSYPTATSYVDTSVTNGTAYSYRVLAYVNGAWSGASAIVKATPTAVPQNVKATAGTKSATISWTAVNGATKYRIQRLNGTSWSTVGYPTSASYTDNGLTTGTTYKYRVLAYVDGAWSAVSAAVSVTAK